MIELNNLNNYKAYIFDFDGVLYDTEFANMKAYSATFSELKIDIHDADLSKINGQSLDQFLNSLNITLNDKKIDLIKKTKEKLYPSFFDYIERNGLLFTEINRIYQSSKILSIASSASLNNIKNILQFFGDEHYFHSIFSREDVKNTKPNPEIYHKCLDSLGMNADDCIVFEDSDYGIQAAQAARIKTIKVDTYKHEK